MISTIDNNDSTYGIYLTDQWIKFCCTVWKLKSEKIFLHNEGKPYPNVECVLFRDEKNRIVNPPIQLYLGIKFTPSPTNDYIKLSRQWQEMLEKLANYFYNEKFLQIALPPNIIDVRSLRWNDYAIEIRYTYLLQLPVNLTLCDHSIRKNIAKAQRSGYYCSKLNKEHVKSIERIILNTESRQNFSYKMDSDALLSGFSILGDNIFNCYGAWSTDNKLVSIRIVLFDKGMIALDWIAATDNDHLNSGVTQLLIDHVLTDLAEKGCSSFDFCGATIKHIGRYKESWGGALTPFYSFRKKDFFYIILTAKFILPRLKIIKATKSKLKGFKIFIILNKLLKK